MEQIKGKKLTRNCLGELLDNEAEGCGDHTPTKNHTSDVLLYLYTSLLRVFWYHVNFQESINFIENMSATKVLKHCLLTLVIPSGFSFLLVFNLEMLEISRLMLEEVNRRLFSFGI